MTPFRTILVAADFSEASREAFRSACSIAREDKTRLFVLNVLEPKYEAAAPVYFGDETVHFTRIARDPTEHDSVKKRLEEAYKPGRPLDVTYQTAEGDAAEEILNSCVAIGCDLIVMGTHGRSGLSRFLAGSVAEAVLRGARCSALAVRERGTAGTAARPEVILHPTDFSECSRMALRVAHSVAQARGARLLILHVIPRETVLDRSLLIPIDVQAARESLDSLAHEVSGPDLSHPVGTLVGHGNAAEEIIRVAQQEPGCGLIVMGTHGRSGFGRLLMGSVAEATLRNSDCPVLMVKSPQPKGSPVREHTSVSGVKV